MPYYIAPYIGSGTDLDPFRPRGSDDPTWSAIDLRPDPTRLDGGGLNACLLWVFTPSSDPALFRLADGEQEMLSPSRRNGLRTRLGLTTLAASRWDQIALELLMTPPANGWKALRPSRVQRRYELWLGPGSPLVTQSVIAGGTTITEDWNCADADSPDCDLDWTEVSGDWDIVSNAIQLVSGAGNLFLRAESDLASDDHYAQVVFVTGPGTTNYGPVCRFAAAATTAYLGIHRTAPWETFRVVTGSFTQIATGATPARADGQTLKIQADGSSIQMFVNGSSVVGPSTDTNITGNTRCGLMGNTSSGAENFDNFEAADLAAGGATWPGWFHSRGGWTA